MDKMNPNKAVGEETMNSRYQRILAANKGSAQASGKDVQDQPHRGIPNGQHPVGPMRGDLMTWTSMLESLTAIYEGLDGICEDPGQCAADPNAGYDKAEVLQQLSDLFTPILVTQGFESEIADKMKSEYESAGELTERNIVQFDDETRMAQLIATCALLIQRAKNTEKYQSYEKAAMIRNQLKLDMQREEYDAAKALAQEFLVKVATTNNSSVARQAANDLLPATQH